MIKVLKKNQLAILVISLMLITAGYLNYDASYNGETKDASSNPSSNELDIASIGDAELVSSDVVNKVDENKVQENVSQEIVDKNNEIASSKETSSNDDYFETSKLERNVMYSQMIERYQNIINSSNQNQEQKAIAEKEISEMNNLQNAIMITEKLLTSKGFNQNVIFVNGDSINVIIGKEELKTEEVAQIQNIVSRELKAEPENIHISVK